MSCGKRSAALRVRFCKGAGNATERPFRAGAWPRLGKILMRCWWMLFRFPKVHWIGVN